MFSWLRGSKPVSAVWTIAPSPDHTYLVFADAGLDVAVAPALADLDAALAKASRENRDDLAGDDATDESVVDAFDDEGKIRSSIADAVTVEPIDDVDAARAASADPAAFADATHAVRVRLHVFDRVDPLLPYALLAVAATIARHAGGRVADTLGRRVIPDGLVAEPLAGLAIGSAGPHVTIVPSTDADGTRRFTTLGLTKYGLFEVTLGGVPAALPRASEIVAAFVQSIVEPFPPFVPGPWKPRTEYVGASGVRAFYDADGPDKKKPNFSALRTRPGADVAAAREIVNERGHSLDAAAIAAILRRFDDDRAAALRDRAEAAT